MPEAPKAVEKPTVQAATMPVAEAPKPIKGGKDISTKAKAAQVIKESKPSIDDLTDSRDQDVKDDLKERLSKTPKVTKVAEGEHGTGKIAQQAKARERVAKVRAVKGSTALGGGKQEVTGGAAAEEELKKADARVRAPDIDVAKLDAVDLEQKLRGLDAKKFKEAIDMRKKHQMSSEEYTEVLRFFYTEAMEGGLKDSEK